MTTALLLIDPQYDFIDPKGTLSVKGAVEDTQRTIEFIKTNADQLDAIYITQDWHQKEHIAHASWWVDADGNPPAPFTNISAADVESGKWKAKNPAYQAHSLQYVQQLEAGKKYTHTIWPEHCIQDTPGADLPDNLKQALAAWEKQTSKKVIYVKKGSNTHTEQFSALKAEVPQEGDSGTELNTALIKELDKYNRIIVAGQALSHCVAASTMDLIAPKTGIDPAKVKVLGDCCSNVYKCEHLGDEFTRKARERGVHFLTHKMDLKIGTGSSPRSFTTNGNVSNSKHLSSPNGSSNVKTPLLGDNSNNNGRSTKNNSCCSLQ